MSKIIPKIQWSILMSILLCIVTPLCLPAQQSYATNGASVNKISPKENANLPAVIDLKGLLTQLHRLHHLQFVYDDVAIQGVKVPAAILKEPAGQLIAHLTKLLKADGLELSRLGGQQFGITRESRVSAPKIKIKLPDQVHITGTIKDELGNPLVGVTVKVKGKAKGTVTDANGQFSLEVQNDAVLVVSFLGYATKNIPVDGKTSFNISLASNTTGLNQLVVVGYGTKKKVDLTGAISSVDFESNQVASRAVPNISTALAGMASGITVRQPSGLPGGSDATINIRGIGSLNSSRSPLIIIDGHEGSLNMVNPQDVSSISILKDAAAAAIYGSRASNGVILITTKKGSNTNGKISFNYDGRLSFGKPTKTDDIVSYTPDHMRLLNLASTNDGQGVIFSQQQIKTWEENSGNPIDYPNTNWWKALMKPNLTMNHHFSARGGKKNLQFYASFNYYNNDGIIPNTGIRKINFRNNLNYQINDWLEIGDQLAITTSKQKPANDQDILVWWQASTPATVPEYKGKFGGGQDEAEGTANNPLSYAKVIHGVIYENNYSSNFYANITPLKGLIIKASYYLNRNLGNSWRSREKADWWNFRTGVITRPFVTSTNLATTNSKFRSDIFNLFTTYERVFGKHHFKLLLGYNQKYSKNVNNSQTKMNLLSLATPVMDAATNNPTASGNMSDRTLLSYFGRLNYNYMSKYLFEANFRYDGSSKFAPNERWGLFPSFSAGWIISNEDFWNSDVFNFLKIRGSWGILGNNGISDYEWQNLYTPANTIFNGTINPGLIYNSLSNHSLTWESTGVTDIGLDIILLRNLSVGLDYYDKETKNILARIPIPLNNGGVNPPRLNSAHVRNRGFEGEVGYNGKIGDLSINFNVNVSYNKNKIVKYKGDLIEPHGGQKIWTEGYPIGVFWLLKVDHIIQDQKEVDNLIGQGYTFETTTPGPGDFLYKDENGDKRIDLDDRVLMGHPIPVVNYGANLSLNYKDFDFYMLLYGVEGWDKYLAGTLYQSQRLVNYLAAKSLLDTWTPDNRNTNVPKVYLNDTKNDQPSDHYLKDASFLKIKSLQLGYSIPSHVLKFIGFDRIRIFVELEDYFTFTSYPGQDPENNQKSYPIIRTITTGLNLQF